MADSATVNSTSRSVSRDRADGGDEVAVDEVDLEQDAVVLDRGVDGDGVVGQRGDVGAGLGEGDRVGKQHDGAFREGVAELPPWRRKPRGSGRKVGEGVDNPPERAAV